LRVPKEKVIDTNGAGDIFHGASIYSVLTNPEAPWDVHFRFARAASAYSIQHLGNEASLPTLADINETQARFPEARALPWTKLAVVVPGHTEDGPVKTTASVARG
jgi:sulfofructose kinase